MPVLAAAALVLASCAPREMDGALAGAAPGVPSSAERPGAEQPAAPTGSSTGGGAGGDSPTTLFPLLLPGFEQSNYSTECDPFADSYNPCV